MLAIIWGVPEKSLANFKTSKLITELLFHAESEFTRYLNDSQKLRKEKGGLEDRKGSAAIKVFMGEEPQLTRPQLMRPPISLHYLTE